MARYVVSGSDLTDVADAIREKGGTSEMLSFPDGFEDAIAALPDEAVLQEKSVDPTTEQQVVEPDEGKDGLSKVRVGAISPVKSAADLTANGDTVTVPAGWYEQQAQKTIAAGSASMPNDPVIANPVITVGNNGLINASVNTSRGATPVVSPGYVASGTLGSIYVRGVATEQLPVQAAQTITPGTQDQTIPAGKFLTGAQTVKGDANLVAGNIKKDVTIFGVTGTHEGGAASPHVYGVVWPVVNKLLQQGGGTRTDDAAQFAAPVPSVGGSAGSSPFDTCLPWSGMQVTVDPLAGAFVSIPRFWYKWTKTSSTLKLQIADAPLPGFCVSPAHADRGDGKGERDVVYVARYKCAGQMGVSVSGEQPVTDIPRYFMRTICKYGADYGGQTVVPSAFGIWQQDVAMFWTVRLLMLVEYAHWDLQTVLGKGCGTGIEGHITCPDCGGSGEVEQAETCPGCDGSGEDPESGETCETCGGSGEVTETVTCPRCDGSGEIMGESGQTEPDPTGSTDNMPYHTGTVQASLDDWGQGIQYRYIEDLWAGTLEWLDGFCVNEDAPDWPLREMYLQTNPAHFADVPYAMRDVVDESDENWAEWCAANVDLLNGSYDGDDPADYFDADEMQAIAGYCVQNESDYFPEYGNLGGNVAVCVEIAGTLVFRKRIDHYSVESGALYARTGWFSAGGMKLRGVLDLNGGTMYAEDEDGVEVLSKDGMFAGLIGSATQDGIRIGKVVSGWIYGWDFPDNAGLGWFGVPITDVPVGEGDPDAVADRCNLGFPSLACGGAWFAFSGCGPFCLASVVASGAFPVVGSRLQKLP